MTENLEKRKKKYIYIYTLLVMKLKVIMPDTGSFMYVSLSWDYTWQANQMMASVWQAILSVKQDLNG